MCNKITTKCSECGHEEVHDIPCNEVLDGAACSGKKEQMDTDDEKKCPDCQYYDNALLQIATDEKLAPHVPTEASIPIYTGPKMYHIRRLRWKHCGHIKDEWTNEECFVPEHVYLEEEQEFACDKCSQAHPRVLAQMREEGKLQLDDAWGLSIKDPTNHPDFGITPSNAAAGASRAPSTQPPATSRVPPAALPIRSPPTEDASLYTLTPPAGQTSYYAEDEPAEPAEPEDPAHDAPTMRPRSGNPVRTTQPPRPATTRPPAADLLPIHENALNEEEEEGDDPVARAGGPVPVPVPVPLPFDDDDDLSSTDSEASDPMRPAVLAMPSVAPPAFASKLPIRARQPPRHEQEAEYEIGPEEALHDEAPPKWGSGAADDDDDEEEEEEEEARADEREELTPEEVEEAKRLNFPAGCKVTRRLLERRREEEGMARRRLLIPEERGRGAGGRK